MTAAASSERDIARMFDRTCVRRYRSVTILRMRTFAIIAYLSVAACGGSKKQAPAPPPPVAEKKEEPAEPPPPEPEKPKHLGAKAALTPVKGAKIDPGTVTFEQDADSGAKVVSELSGL